MQDKADRGLQFGPTRGVGAVQPGYTGLQTSGNAPDGYRDNQRQPQSQQPFTPSSFSDLDADAERSTRLANEYYG